MQWLDDVFIITRFIDDKKGYFIPIYHNSYILLRGLSHDII